MRQSFVPVLVLTLVGLMTVPVASAAVTNVHLGLPTSDPSSGLSVVWMEATPRDGASVTLDGPDGSRTIPGRLIPGPSASIVYEAVLGDLAPATAYTYNIDGREFAFATPAATSTGGSVNFVALGDMGVSTEAKAAIAKVNALDPAFLIHAGDIAYAEGDQTAWQTWFANVEGVASTRPWITALGNHETYVVTSVRPIPPAPTEVAYYKQVFSLPGNEIWYSYDWEGIHFVVLDTFSDMNAPTADQLAWLEQDLAANADAQWTIALVHETIYSSNRHGSHANLQDAFGPIFEKHGVDVVVQGHDHGYERSYPLKAGQVTDSSPSLYPKGAGVIYMVTGGAGAGMYTAWEEPAPAWSAARKSVYHVVEFNVTADVLRAEVVLTGTDAFADSFTIARVIVPATEAAPQGEPAAATPAAGAVIVIAVALGLARVTRRRAS